MLFLDIGREGTVSQISFIQALVPVLRDLENNFQKNYKSFPDFLHKIKTEASVEKIWDAVASKSVSSTTIHILKCVKYATVSKKITLKILTKI